MRVGKWNIKRGKNVLPPNYLNFIIRWKTPSKTSISRNIRLQRWTNREHRPQKQRGSNPHRQKNNPQTATRILRERKHHQRWGREKDWV